MPDAEQRALVTTELQQMLNRENLWLNILFCSFLTILKLFLSSLFKDDR